MTNLHISTGNFDQINTFGLEVMDWKKRPIIVKCSLRSGYKTENDNVIWALKSSAMVKDTYTAADYAECERVYKSEPVRHGDTVEIGGAAYRVKVLGNYSDAAIFEPIQ
jgi:hypothetical protein